MRYTADEMTEMLEQASPLVPAKYHKVAQLHEPEKQRTGG